MHKPVAVNETPNLLELVEASHLDASELLDIDVGTVVDGFDGVPGREFSACADALEDGEESDVRLKTDIEQVGTTVYGLPLFHFRYKTGPEIFEGVMAQDVLEVMPDAVMMGEDGYYRVNYGRLGIRMIQA